MKHKGQDHGHANIVAVQPRASNLMAVQPGAPGGNGYPYDQAGQQLISQNTNVQGLYNYIFLL